MDDNKNKLKDTTSPVENNYTSQISAIKIHSGINTCRDDTLVTTSSNASGRYDTGRNLFAGIYTVCYTNLPTGYEMTFPITLIMPAFFNVTVGPSCSQGTSNSATCSGGDIENANFGITNSFPWIQSIGRDMRVDSGYSQRIPYQKFASLKRDGGTPGVIFSGNSAPFFGEGSASENPYNWVVGTPPYGDKYTSSHHLVTTSYEYQLSNAKDYGLERVDISSHCGANGISNCVLSSTIPHGLYIANGNLTISNSSSYTFPANSNYVILVKGDLHLKQNILLPTTSTATFSVKGDIYVDKSVGESTHSSIASNLDGFYSTDKSFIVESANMVNGLNDCVTAYTDTTKRDKRLNIGGSVITNASLSEGGKLINQRDLCGSNLTYPTIYFSERLDLILNAPRLIQNIRKTYQEVPPK